MDERSAGGDEHVLQSKSTFFVVAGSDVAIWTVGLNAIFEISRTFSYFV